MEAAEPEHAGGDCAKTAGQDALTSSREKASSMGSFAGPSIIGRQLHSVGAMEATLGVLVAAILVGMSGTDRTRFTGYTLAFFTGMLFIILAQLMKGSRVQCIQAAGEVMQKRVLNTVDNWRDHTLRSFLEMISWMYVIFRVFESTQNIALSMGLGTVSGCGMVLLGEQFSQHIRKLDQEYMYTDASDKSGRAGKSEDTNLLQLNMSWLLFFVLVIVGHLGDLRDLALGFWLATLTGIGFITFGQLLLVWHPTHRCGLVLQRRVCHCRENWAAQPLRCALEMTSFFGIILASFAVWRDPFFSVLSGTVGGALVCLSSEFLTSVVTECSGLSPRAAASRKKGFSMRADAFEEPEEGPVLLPICLGCYALLSALYMVMHHFHDTVLAVVLAVLAGLCIVTIGRLFVVCPFTRSAGIVLQDRVLKTVDNWRNHCVRSAFESSLFACTVCVTMRLEQNFVVAIQLATAVGCAAALVNEALTFLCQQRSRPRHKRNPAAKSLSADPSHQITWEELKKHTTEDDCWVAVHGKVYDVTEFAPQHPGGSILASFGGRDVSDEFEAFHVPRVRHRLPPYCVGTLSSGPEELPSTRDYRQLRALLWKEGWFEADLVYVACKDGIALAILLLGLCCVVSGSSCVVRVLLGGAAVGLALQQVAFVAHDAGHNGIQHPAPGGGINWLGWLHGTVLFGVSAEMWLDEHSRHHAMTMRPREDPQFNYLPIWLVSEKELSKLHELTAVERVVAKLLVPFQHLTMIPLSMIIGRFNLHAISMFWAIKHKKLHDVAGLSLYFAWFGSVVALLPANEQLAFVLTAYITAGILHIQLTISHLATDCFTAEEDEKEQFFAFQMKTTRNIDCMWWDDWLHGGLQYQIEHHLFPQMPRHCLAKVRPLVIELCNKHNLPYRSTGFFDAVGECLADFRRLSHFVGDLAYPDEILG
jgi:fatty acid desaturase/predicted heme/steroid binding protein